MMVVLVAAAFGCHAGEAAPAAADPVLEKRVLALAQELRCLVCQNQTLADSHADLALDLKKQVRAKLAAGMSEREVVDYMVQRYGDFVLYKPPVKATTWLLWYGPFLLLGLGLIALFRNMSARQREEHRREERGDDEALRRAATLLDGAAMEKERA
jgi:cytochrome c-type biogenesis protein CcmH